MKPLEALDKLIDKVLAYHPKRAKKKPQRRRKAKKSRRGVLAGIILCCAFGVHASNGPAQTPTKLANQNQAISHNNQKETTNSSPVPPTPPPNDTSGIHDQTSPTFNTYESKNDAPVDYRILVLTIVLASAALAQVGVMYWQSNLIRTSIKATRIAISASKRGVNAARRSAKSSEENIILAKEQGENAIKDSNASLENTRLELRPYVFINYWNFAGDKSYKSTFHFRLSTHSYNGDGVFSYCSDGNEETQKNHNS